nr:TPA: protein kinase domain-containing protein [Neospora caninum Liverpool]
MSVAWNMSEAVANREAVEEPNASPLPEGCDGISDKSSLPPALLAAADPSPSETRSEHACAVASSVAKSHIPSSPTAWHSGAASSCASSSAPTLPPSSPSLSRVSSGSPLGHAPWTGKCRSSSSLSLQPDSPNSASPSVFASRGSPEATATESREGDSLARRPPLNFFSPLFPPGCPYTPLALLGTGAISRVFQCLDQRRNPPTFVAVKLIRKQILKRNPILREQVINEKEALRRLSVPCPRRGSDGSLSLSPSSTSASFSPPSSSPPSSSPPSSSPPSSFSPSSFPPSSSPASSSSPPASSSPASSSSPPASSSPSSSSPSSSSPSSSSPASSFPSCGTEQNKEGGHLGDGEKPIAREGGRRATVSECAEAAAAGARGLSPKRQEDDRRGGRAGEEREGEEDDRTNRHRVCPFIPRLLHAFQDAQRLFLVMNLSGFSNLQEILHRVSPAHADSPSFPIQLSDIAAKTWTAELVGALEWFRERGVVHRDLKPRNLVISPEGHLCVVDFGAALLLPADGEATEKRAKGRGALATKMSRGDSPEPPQETPSPRRSSPFTPEPALASDTPTTSALAASPPLLPACASASVLSPSSLPSSSAPSFSSSAPSSAPSAPSSAPSVPSSSSSLSCASTVSYAAGSSRAASLASASGESPDAAAATRGTGREREARVAVHSEEAERAGQENPGREKDTPAEHGDGGEGARPTRLGDEAPPRAASAVISDCAGTCLYSAPECFMQSAGTRNGEAPKAKRPDGCRPVGNKRDSCDSEADVAEASLCRAGSSPGSGEALPSDARPIPTPGSPPSPSRASDASASAALPSIHYALDLWSLGCIAYEMLCGRPAFEAQVPQETVEKILTGTVEFPPFLAPDARDFISRLLVVEPTARLGFRDFNELKFHPFLAPLGESIWRLPSVPLVRLYDRKRHRNLQDPCRGLPAADAASNAPAAGAQKREVELEGEGGALEPGACGGTQTLDEPSEDASSQLSHVFNQGAEMALERQAPEHSSSLSQAAPAVGASASACRPHHGVPRLQDPVHASRDTRASSPSPCWGSSATFGQERVDSGHAHASGRRSDAFPLRSEFLPSLPALYVADEDGNGDLEASLELTPSLGFGASSLRWAATGQVPAAPAGFPRFAHTLFPSAVGSQVSGAQEAHGEEDGLDREDARRLPPVWRPAGRHAQIPPERNGDGEADATEEERGERNEEGPSERGRGGGREGEDVGASETGRSDAERRRAQARRAANGKDDVEGSREKEMRARSARRRSRECMRDGWRQRGEKSEAGRRRGSREPEGCSWGAAEERVRERPGTNGKRACHVRNADGDNWWERETEPWFFRGEERSWENQADARLDAPCPAASDLSPADCFGREACRVEQSPGDLTAFLHEGERAVFWGPLTLMQEAATLFERLWSAGIRRRGYRLHGNSRSALEPEPCLAVLTDVPRLLLLDPFKLRLQKSILLSGDGLAVAAEGGDVLFYQSPRYSLLFLDDLGQAELWADVINRTVLLRGRWSPSGSPVRPSSSCCRRCFTRWSPRRGAFSFASQGREAKTATATRRHGEDAQAPETAATGDGRRFGQSSRSGEERRVGGRRLSASYTLARPTKAQKWGEREGSLASEGSEGSESRRCHGDAERKQSREKTRIYERHVSSVFPGRNGGDAQDARESKATWLLKRRYSAIERSTTAWADEDQRVEDWDPFSGEESETDKTEDVRGSGASGAAVFLRDAEASRKQTPASVSHFLLGRAKKVGNAAAGAVRALHRKWLSETDSDCRPR